MSITCPGKALLPQPGASVLTEIKNVAVPVMSSWPPVSVAGSTGQYVEINPDPETGKLT
jgi:hypothetical protein